MTRQRKWSIWGAAAGAGALTAAGVAAQRRLMKQIAADPARELLQTPPDGRTSTVRASDGTSLHVAMFGPEFDRDAPTVVLIPGWTETTDVWTYVVRDLVARGLRIITYDLRGHGRSDSAASGEYSMARFGQDVEDVLAACLPEGQRAIIAGHSMGGMSIVAWAEHHDVATRAAGVALLFTGIANLITDQLVVPVPPIAQGISAVVTTHGFLGVRAPLPRFSTPVSHAIIKQVAFGPDTSPAKIAFYERMLIGTPPDARASAGLAMSAMDLRDALPKLTVPTLVMAGERDRLTPPSHARRIAEALPHLERLIILPRVGHMGHLEAPAEVSDALAELVSAVTPRSASVTA
jgi:pimeloyl-ACP methyl ester carboxylesterase